MKSNKIKAQIAWKIRVFRLEILSTLDPDSNLRIGKSEPPITGWQLIKCHFSILVGVPRCNARDRRWSHRRPPSSQFSYNVKTLLVLLKRLAAVVTGETCRRGRRYLKAEERESRREAVSFERERGHQCVWVWVCVWGSERKWVLKFGTWEALKFRTN